MSLPDVQRLQISRRGRDESDLPSDCRAGVVSTHGARRRSDIEAAGMHHQKHHHSHSGDNDNNIVDMLTKRPLVWRDLLLNPPSIQSGVRFTPL